MAGPDAHGFAAGRRELHAFRLGTDFAFVEPDGGVDHVACDVKHGLLVGVARTDPDPAVAADTGHERPGLIAISPLPEAPFVGFHAPEITP